MKKNLQKFLLIAITSFIGVTAFSQNQVYWKEGFEPSPGDTSMPKCTLTTVSPTAKDSGYFKGNGGIWYGKNVYRTTSTGCPNGYATPQSSDRKLVKLR